MRSDVAIDLRRVRRHDRDTQLTRITMNPHRWQQLMLTLGIAANLPTFDALCAAYTERHRHYHTTRHIEECLRHLDWAKHLAREPAEIEIALWFHDAIYDTYRSDNEAKSAQWTCDFLLSNQVAAKKIERIRELILATRHQATAADLDAQLLVDIDLAILGANVANYAEFEKNVREEYKWVPSIVFRKKRAEILQSFMDRPQIYSRELFRERYEQQARANLAAAIAALSE